MKTPPCKEISINAFYANSPGQNWIGLWSMPDSRAARAHAALAFRGVHRHRSRLTNQQ